MDRVIELNDIGLEPAEEVDDLGPVALPLGRIRPGRARLVQCRVALPKRIKEAHSHEKLVRPPVMIEDVRFRLDQLWMNALLDSGKEISLIFGKRGEAAKELIGRLLRAAPNEFGVVVGDDQYPFAFQDRPRSMSAETAVGSSSPSCSRSIVAAQA